MGCNLQACFRLTTCVEVCRICYTVQNLANLELDNGGVVPPVTHVADLVELPALVVEGVAQLVPHHHADRTVVDAPRVLWRI